MPSAKFLTPGVLYVTSALSSEFRFLKPAFGRALEAGYTRFVEPACGAFAMCHLAQQAGWQGAQMEASDVTLFSTAMGYGIMGKSLEALDVRIRGFEDCDLNDPATVLWAQAVARARFRAAQDYWAEITRSMMLRKAEHIATIQQALTRAAGLLGGLDYRPRDLFEHLEDVKDDVHAIVSLNPPSSGGGYEKFFDTGGAVTWREPAYETFDPVEGYRRLDGYMKDSRALLAIHEETQAAKQPGDAFIARGSGRKAPTDLGVARSINYYILSNRPEEFK